MFILRATRPFTNTFTSHEVTYTHIPPHQFTSTRTHIHSNAPLHTLNSTPTPLHSHTPSHPHTFTCIQTSPYPHTQTRTPISTYTRPYPRPHISTHALAPPRTTGLKVNIQAEERLKHTVSIHVLLSRPFLSLSLSLNTFPFLSLKLVLFLFLSLSLTPYRYPILVPIFIPTIHILFAYPWPSTNY